MRGKESREKTNCGKIVEVRVNLGETGMGRVFVATHSCSVQSEMLNEAHAKKNICIYIYIYIYLTRYSPISRQAGINFLPSLVPCAGSEKSVSPDILTSQQVQKTATT